VASKAEVVGEDFVHLSLSKRGCRRHRGGGQSSGERPQKKARGERPQKKARDERSVYLKRGCVNMRGWQPAAMCTSGYGNRAARDSHRARARIGPGAVPAQGIGEGTHGWLTVGQALCG
jgi:hypothetical protein